ncbi:Conserved protein of unknown function [Mycobacterium canettii CIPT 140070010]|nr:Conserved protein of unknown function [Mycobacterium canettii CIPT 140070010]
MTNTPPPTTGQWTPTYPPAPAHSRNWPLATVASIAIVAVALGAAALIVALTRPTTSGSATPPATTATPTYTAAETAAAHQKLCEVYKRAARAVQIQTNRDDPGLANISTVNGAVILQQATDKAPALAPDDRTAALELAEAYSNSTVAATLATGREDPAWRSAAENVIAKDARMKAVCGGG